MRLNEMFGRPGKAKWVTVLNSTFITHVRTLKIKELVKYTLTWVFGYWLNWISNKPDMIVLHLKSLISLHRWYPKYSPWRYLFHDKKTKLCLVQFND